MRPAVVAASGNATPQPARTRTPLFRTDTSSTTCPPSPSTFHTVVHWSTIAIHHRQLHPPSPSTFASSTVYGSTVDRGRMAFDGDRRYSRSYQLSRHFREHAPQTASEVRSDNFCAEDVKIFGGANAVGMLSPRPTRDSTVCSATTGFAPPASCLAPVRQASPALPVADAVSHEFSLLDEPLFSRRALDLIAEMATEPTAKGGDVAGATTPPREDSPLGVPQEDLGANTAATSRKRPYDEIANPETGQRLLLVAPDRPDRPGLPARLPEHQARARPPPPSAAHPPFARCPPSRPPRPPVSPRLPPRRSSRPCGGASTRNRRRRHRPLPPPTPQGQPPMQGWKAPPTTPSFA